MNTNEEQACSACGEPASTHPVVLDQGDKQCRTYIEPGRDLVRLRLAVKAAPKRPDPTPEQERALGRREAISERIRENLDQRKALFLAASAADMECPEWDRLAPNALVDIEVITYGLASCEAFLPRELSDDRKRRWHLILDPIGDPRVHGFMVFCEPSDPSSAPSEELLALLRGKKDFGNIVDREALSIDEEVRLQEKRNSDMLGEVRALIDAWDGETTLDGIKRLKKRIEDLEVAPPWRAFMQIAAELFPDAPDELMQVPLEDAVTSCLGRIKSLRRGDEESVKASMEIAERSRQIARALRVEESMPWKWLVTHVAERDRLAQRLEDVESARDEAFRMRDEAIARIEKIQGEWSKANTELNTAAVERDRARQERDHARAQREAQPLSVDQTISLAYALGCERVGTPRLGDTMIAVATALKKGAEETKREESFFAVDPKKAAPAGRFATPSHVLLEERLAKLERAFDGWGPNEMLFGKVSDPEARLQHEAQARELGKLVRRVAEIETQVGAVEAAGTAFISTHRKQQQEIAALEPLFKNVHDAVKEALVRVAQFDDKVGLAKQGVTGVARRVDRLDGWRKRVSKLIGEGEVDISTGALAQMQHDRDEALAELVRLGARKCLRCAYDRNEPGGQAVLHICDKHP